MASKIQQTKQDFQNKQMVKQCYPKRLKIRKINLKILYYYSTLVVVPYIIEITLNIDLHLTDCN